MPKIIGRKQQMQVLEEAYRSEIPELIALYGRRRVGKTYLIRNFFHDKSDTLFLTMTGIKDALVIEQTKAFSEVIGETFYGPGAAIKIQENWRDAFNLLTQEIRRCPKKKIVLFFDEFPWMASRGSRLLRTFEYFWNQFWSQDSRIKIVICGSSSGWIIKNIVHNRGGLYNRVTRSIQLRPFNLHDTKAYLEYLNVKLNLRDITDLYMALGGVPFYLSKVKPGYSATQVLEYLAFQKDSFLLHEFSHLYATLFGSEGAYIDIMRALSERRYGMNQKDLTEKIGRIGTGGRISSWLEELEQAGFIMRVTPFGRKRKGIFYRISDEYSLFYFKWIEPIKRELLEEGERAGYWEQLKNSPSWHSWSGYAFEALCFKHIRQIREALKLSPAARAYSWQYVSKKKSNEQGAQIDLLFDRSDNGITLCDIKYSRTPFVLDKEYASKLRRQIEVFKKETKTQKNIFITFVSAEGLKKTFYSEELVHGVVTLRDLFKNS